MCDDREPLKVPTLDFTDLLHKAEPEGRVAAPRTVVSRGTLKSIRPAIVRPGALDYRDIPSRAGDERRVHSGPTSTASCVRIIPGDRK